MKETVKTARCQLIGVYECWTWDYWDEINHEDPGMRVPDEGPSSYAAVCAASFAKAPGDAEIAEAFAAFDVDFDLGVGHAVRTGHCLRSTAELEKMAEEGSFGRKFSGSFEPFETLLRNPTYGAGIASFADIAAQTPNQP